MERELGKQAVSLRSLAGWEEGSTGKWSSNESLLPDGNTPFLRCALTESTDCWRCMSRAPVHLPGHSKMLREET